MDEDAHNDRSCPPSGGVASSGDVVLDRRREWALAAAQDGFHRGAADIYEQILERAPHWAVAWFELGEARIALDERDGAIAAFRAAMAHDPHGVLAAQLKLAALGATHAPAAPPAAYVAGLFDQYADRFDTHLVGALDYRGPELLRAALQHACDQAELALHFERALDLGCGTGLMGLALQDVCTRIDGVDISQRMIEVARRSGVYRHLATDDVTGWLMAQDRGAADLVVAADVFVYLGDLAQVFAASALALKPEGLFAFTVQKGDGDFTIGDDMRYAHGEDYIRRLAAAHGFAIAVLDDVSTRKDRGLPVAGLLAVLRKHPEARRQI